VTRVSVSVNGFEHQKEVEPRMLLSDFLRHELRLTGTHVGCEHGVCGCCTILLDGVATRSCLLFAVQADGSGITTIEGLADGPRLGRVQAAFAEHHALQCGFCTPGFVIASHALLEESGDRPMDRSAIRQAISGNLCRCTGYQSIVDAIESIVGREPPERSG